MLDVGVDRSWLSRDCEHARFNCGRGRACWIRGERSCGEGSLRRCKRVIMGWSRFRLPDNFRIAVQVSSTIRVKEENSHQNQRRSDQSAPTMPRPRPLLHNCSTRRRDKVNWRTSAQWLGAMVCKRRRRTTRSLVCKIINSARTETP